MKRRSNNSLNEKQKKFCENYNETLNARKSAILAGYSEVSAKNIGYKLLRQQKIQTYLRKLKKDKKSFFHVTIEDIVYKYIDIAFNDMTDYATINKDGYLKFKNFDNVDGTLIQEISQGKEGVKVKIIDRLKALDFLTNFFGANKEMLHKFNMDSEKLDLQRRKVELEEQRLKAEIESDENIQESIDRFVKSTKISDSDLEKIFEDDVKNDIGKTEK